MPRPTDTPEPFVRQQRRIQEAAGQIATSRTQSLSVRIDELDRAKDYLDTLTDQLCGIEPEEDNRA